MLRSTDGEPVIYQVTIQEDGIPISVAARLTMTPGGFVFIRESTGEVISEGLTYEEAASLVVFDG